jgi:hypothetical protein
VLIIQIDVTFVCIKIISLYQNTSLEAKNGNSKTVKTRQKLPEVAEILKLAGSPLTTGFGDISIPDTLTG